MRSAPRLAAVMANASGEVPSTVRIVASNVMVAQTGRPTDLPAIMAAFISLRSIIVSMMIRSAPPSSSALACSVNISTASSKLKSPTGSRNEPVGPMSPATYARSPAILRAHLAAAIFISLVLQPSPYSLSLGRFAPKVLVVITSAPASMYAECTLLTMAGSLSISSSGHPPGFNPSLCSMVPVAPSNMSGFSVNCDRKSKDISCFSLFYDGAIVSFYWPAGKNEFGKTAKRSPPAGCRTPPDYPPSFSSIASSSFILSLSSAAFSKSSFFDALSISFRSDLMMDGSSCGGTYSVVSSAAACTV